MLLLSLFATADPVSAQVRTAASPSPATVAAAPAFDILEYQIDGNSVLATAAIEQAVTPYLGPGKTVSDAEAARAALEKAYQSAGYLTVFVDLPEQRIDSGVVQLTVTEGKVSRLRVTDAHYYSQGYIRTKVPELAEGKVPNFNEVQRELALVNRDDNRRVQPVMRAGREPGTVETDLKVEDRLPLTATVDVNNRHAPGTTPWRVDASLRYDNLFQRDHSLSISAATAPAATDQSRVLSVNYTIPNDDQSAWVAYLVNSNSNVAALGAVDVLGKGTTVGLRRVQPLGATAEQQHSIAFGIDYKDIREETRSGASVISTPLKYLPFSAAYNGSVDQGGQRALLLNLQLLAAFRPILQRNVDCPGGIADQFACKRFNGDGGFATVRADLHEGVPLASGTLRLRLGGQLATGPVPTAEQYTVGGAETVRGYLEAEGAGDRALLGSLEWNTADWSTDLARLFTKPTPVRAHALGFFDLARAYTIDPAVGQAPHMSLAGAGIGLRLNLAKSVLGEFDLAWPLKSTVATAAHSPRLHVKFGVEL